MNIEKKLEALKTYVKNRSDEDAQAIIKDAQKSAKEINMEYSDKAKEEYSKIVEEAKKQAYQIQRKEKAQADSRRTRMIMEGHKEIVDDALELLKGKIFDLTKDKSYSNLLAFMTLEAVKSLESKKITLKFRKTDRSLIEKIVENISKNVKVEITLSDEDAKIVGGVIALSADGKQIVENTLESKFEELKEEYLHDLFSTLKVR
jgi:vacuolar-type H+-ATPase subunit E/Vma4